MNWDSLQPIKKYACGMCPSCYQLEACPGGCDGLRCNNYLPPEPGRREWMDILRKALVDLQKASHGSEYMYLVGRVTAIKDAMTEIHGYSYEEIEVIEHDLHPVRGGGDILP